MTLLSSRAAAIARRTTYIQDAQTLRVMQALHDRTPSANPLASVPLCDAARLGELVGAQIVASAGRVYVVYGE